MYADLAMDKQILKGLFTKKAGPCHHKKVYRVYKLLKKNKKRRGKRRLPARVKEPLMQQKQINNSCSMDFISDSLMGIRKFKTFNVMDDCSKESLAIEIDASLSSKRTIDQRGKPKTIRTDSELEFTSKDFELWCKDQWIENQHIQPGKPM